VCKSVGPRLLLPSLLPPNETTTGNNYVGATITGVKRLQEHATFMAL